MLPVGTSYMHFSPKPTVKHTLTLDHLILFSILHFKVFLAVSYLWASTGPTNLGHKKARKMLSER